MEKFCQVIYLLTKFMLKFIHFDFRIEKFIYLYQNVSSIIYIDAYAYIYYKYTFIEFNDIVIKVFNVNQKLNLFVSRKNA